MTSTRKRSLSASLLVLATLLPALSVHADELPVLGPELQLGQPSQTTRGGTQEEPDIVCTDGLCLLVWGDGSFMTGPDTVMAALIDEAGRPGVAFRVSEARGSYVVAPAVATDGRDFVVTWSDHEDIRAVRVGRDGSLGAELELASGSDGVYHSDPAIAATQDGRFLVVWSSIDTVVAGDFIAGALIDANDTVTAGLVISEPAAGNHLFPSVTSDGERFLVSWTRSRYGLEGEPDGGDTLAAFVSADGGIGEQLVLDANHESWWTAATSSTFDGDDFLVAWHTVPVESDQLSDLVVASVGADGTVTPGVPVLARRADVSRKAPQLRSDGAGGVMLVWYEAGDDRDRRNGELRAAPRAPDGAWGAEVVLHSWHHHAASPGAIAARAGRFVVAWEDGDRYDVVAREVDASGRPLDDAPRVMATGGAEGAQQVVAGRDGRHLVLWADGNSTTPLASELVAALVDAAGNVVRKATLPTGNGIPHCVRAAGDGERFLVTFANTANDATSPVGLWLEADAVPGAKFSLPLEGEGERGCVPVASDGERFLVTWLERDETASPQPGPVVVRGALVEPGAPTAEPFTVAVLPDGGTGQSLTVAGAPGAGFLVTWRTIWFWDLARPYEVHAVRVDPSGTVGEPLPITTGEIGVQLRDAVADASGFTVYWTGASVAGVTRMTRALATRVDLDGGVHPAAVLAESSEGVPEYDGAFAHDGERTLAVWPALDGDPPAGLAAAVWRGEQPPVRLDTGPPTGSVSGVQLAWASDRGLVVYTRDHLVHVRTLGVDAPEPGELGDVASDLEVIDADSAAGEEDPVTVSPELASNPADGVGGAGCCTAVRTHTPESGSAWWVVFGIVALLGGRRIGRARIPPA